MPKAPPRADLFERSAARLAAGAGIGSAHRDLDISGAESVGSSRNS
jgi:hypothetical protein